MKVSELIELLRMENQDAEVHFSYNYGDHWRTQVAPAVSSVQADTVAYSEYHRMDKIVADEAEYDEETGQYVQDENVRQVVVIE